MSLRDRLFGQPPIRVDQNALGQQPTTQELRDRASDQIRAMEAQHGEDWRLYREQQERLAAGQRKLTPEEERREALFQPTQPFTGSDDYRRQLEERQNTTPPTPLPLYSKRPANHEPTGQVHIDGVQTQKKGRLGTRISTDPAKRQVEGVEYLETTPLGKDRRIFKWIKGK